MSWLEDRPARRDTLFWSKDGYEVQRNLLAEITAAIDRLPEARTLNTDLEELARYYVEKHHVAVPTIDASDIVVSQHERDILVHDWRDDRLVRVPGAAFDVEIPFEGEADVFLIRPNQYDSGPPEACVAGNVLMFSVEGRELTTEAVKAAIDETVRSIEKYLGWHREFWRGFDDRILATARQQIEARRRKLHQQNSVATGLANLGFKLKEKPGDPRTYVAPAVKQRIEPQMPPNAGGCAERSHAGSPAIRNNPGSHPRRWAVH